MYVDDNILFRFCQSSVIIPICTKVDRKEYVLDSDIREEILSSCKKMIQDSLKQQTGNKRKVVLLNDIIHFTSKAVVEDSDDPRKNSKYLRDLIAALCEFYFQGQFFIPNSWDKIGKPDGTALQSQAQTGVLEFKLGVS